MINFLSALYSKIKISSYIEESIIIQSPITHVWSEFQNIKNYSEWNTLFSIQKFPSYVGERPQIKLYSNNRTFLMYPKILKIENYCLEWEGKLYLNGLLNGYHKFIFTRIDHQRTLLIQAEYFQGILVLLLNKRIIQPIKMKFQEMNYAFAAYIENKNKL